jgi:hypothetical protein
VAVVVLMPAQSRRTRAAAFSCGRTLSHVMSRSFRFVSSSVGGKFPTPGSSGSRFVHRRSSALSAGSVICTTPGIVSTSDAALAGSDL